MKTKNNETVVYILCGKVASGKTTYAEELEKSKNAVVLSCDRLMLTIFDECLNDAHDLYESRSKCFLRDTALSVVRSGVSAVLDAGYFYEAERNALRRFFVSKNITTELHYIKTDESLRLRWLEERNRKYDQKNDGVRRYIISEDLRKYLDAKFQEPESPDKIIGNQQ